MDKRINIFWFRRDLRFDDNHALFKALSSNLDVLPIFIFDTDILDGLPKDDARVSFIYNQLQKMRQELQDSYDCSLAIFHGSVLDVFQKLIKTYAINAIYTNHDYEPYALKRDMEIHDFLKNNKIGFYTFKDQVIFEKNEITKKDGTPYKVYTPYMKIWKSVFKSTKLEFYPSENHLAQLIKNEQLPNIELADMGFNLSNQRIADYDTTPELIQQYESKRNYPGVKGTSKIGPHLRFGTVSIRNVLKKAIAEQNETFWQELIWREFFMQILWHYPKTVTESFKVKYDRIKWRNNKNEFKAWCEGNTGYPLVDAGMRELNSTGFMHNRVRMLVGSFLCKHLLIDWRWGEAYFAEKLHDYEMSSNIGNWQWVAGCGVDAAPYFRIFNPTTQILKFDKNHDYIKKWVPEYQELTYTQPVVNHKEARERCLSVYKAALN